MQRSSILLETKILALICLADLFITTMIYLYSGGDPLIERNPLMRFFLTEGGLPGFFMAKVLFSLPGLIALEWYRTRKPHFAIRIGRLVIACYVIVFIGGSLISFIR